MLLKPLTVITIGIVLLQVTIDSTSAQEQFFGRVLQENTNTGIVGATASLSKAGRTVLTDSLGWFNFGNGGIPVRATHQNITNRSIKIHNGNIRIETGLSNEVASVYMYSLNGRIVWSVENVRLNQGINTITINSINAKTTQPLIVKVGLNNNIYTVRVIGLIGKSVLLNMQGNSTSGIKKQSAAMVDTLTVSKYGYFPVTQAVETYSTIGLVYLKLMAPDSIVPPGMKYIPGGTFRMGSNIPGYNNYPDFDVTVSSFYMDSTEVTQEDYHTLLKVKPWLDYKEKWDPGQDSAKHPVWHIYWYDALLYCNARSKRDQLDTFYEFMAIKGIPGNGCELTTVKMNWDASGYRLPTQAEWEYAAHGGTTTQFYWGDKQDSLAQLYSYCKDNSGYTSHRVGQKKPNAFKLYDIAGNAREFCNDYYVDFYYDRFANLDTPVVNPRGPADVDGYIVIKDGGWADQLIALGANQRRACLNVTRNRFHHTNGIRPVRPIKK